MRMKFGAEWRCGKCGKIYSTRQLLGLEKAKADEKDDDPGKQHGYVSVCTCGYRFHLDKWRLHNKLKIKIDDKDTDILVSTVYLELNHGFNGDLWYETGIFIESDIEREDEDFISRMIYEYRYEKKEEAIARHNKILKLLKDGEYIIYKSEENGYTISFKEGD